MMCIKCDKDHDGKFGSGKYCSRACANSRMFSDEAKQKKSIALKGKILRQPKLHTYECESCHIIFDTLHKMRTGRKVHCVNCKRKVDNERISSRTWTKILKRLNAKCSLCGWDEATLDVHHIVERANQGSDDETNLIVLCPNCHRKAHCKKIDKRTLVDNCLAIRYPEWRDKYYH